MKRRTGNKLGENYYGGDDYYYGGDNYYHGGDNYYYYPRQQARSDFIVWSSGDYYYGGDHLNDLRMRIILCDDNEDMDYDDVDDHADHY